MAQKRATKKKTTKTATRKRPAVQADQVDLSTVVASRALHVFDRWGLTVAAFLIAITLSFLAGKILSGGEASPRPEASFEGLAEQVCSLACAVDSDDRQAEASAMAAALDGVIDQARSGEFSDLAETMQAAAAAATGAVAPRNKSSWHSWSTSVDLLLWSYNRDQKLVNPLDAASALTEISRGLSMSAKRS